MDTIVTYINLTDKMIETIALAEASGIWTVSLSDSDDIRFDAIMVLTLID